MVTFLQILLAVILVIAALIVSAWLWIKVKIGKFTEEVESAFRLMPPLYREPARLRFHRCEGDESSELLEEFTKQFKHLGFQRIADLESYDSDYVILRTLRHRELPIAATISESDGNGVCFSLFTVLADKFVFGRASDRDWKLLNSRLDWQSSVGLLLEPTFELVRSKAGETNQNVSLGMIQAVVEQLHSVRIDQQIAVPPTREAIERHALSIEVDATRDQLDEALGYAMDSWKEQINESVLDRYRKTSRIDAVAWEDLRDQVLVVHDYLSTEDIESYLVVDEAGERLLEQLSSQKLKGTELFAAMLERLPRDAQWAKIADVDSPISAQIFSRDEDIDSDERASFQYVYEAEDGNGRKARGAVFATDSADAKAQVASLGMKDAKLLIAPVPGDENFDQFVYDEETAEIAARSTKEGLLKSLSRMIISNWWIWAPPSYLLWQTLREGAPFSWSDYLVFVYIAIAAIAMVFVVGPPFVYNRLLHTQLMVQPKRAKILLWILRRISPASGITEPQLLCEECKILAMDGKLGDAVSALENRRAEYGEEYFQSSLSQVYDAAGRWPEMIAAQRALLVISSITSTVSLDLAMSIARYEQDVSQAEDIIRAIAPDELSEIELIAYHYVVGLLAARRGGYDIALQHYARSNETAKQFVSLPIMRGLVAEIGGYAAIALKRQGENENAENIWKNVWPILRRHHSGKILRANYETV